MNVEITMKDVLDNFAPDEQVEQLKRAMAEALKEATTGEYVDRAIRAAEVLQKTLNSEEG